MIPSEEMMRDWNFRWVRPLVLSVGTHPETGEVKALVLEQLGPAGSAPRVLAECPSEASGRAALRLLLTETPSE